MPSSRKLANGGKSARSSTATAGGGGAGGAAKKKRRRKAAVVVNTTNCKYEVVQDCADERGWRTTTDESGVAWNVRSGGREHNTRTHKLIHNRLTLVRTLA